MRVRREVSSASAAADPLLFARAKRSGQEKARPTLAPRCARSPALLARLGPARTRPSMASNMRAFPPSPAALLGARDGKGEPRTTARAPLLFALDLPSRKSRRRAGGSAATAGARRKRASFSSVHGRTVEKPRRPDANPPKAGAISGCPFSWLLRFGHAKRSNSAAAEADETSRSRSGTTTLAFSGVAGGAEQAANARHRGSASFFIACLQRRTIRAVAPWGSVRFLREGNLGRRRSALHAGSPRQ
jgi:hypothetical protein